MKSTGSVFRNAFISLLAMVGTAVAEGPARVSSGFINVELQTIASGLTSPVDLVSPHDGTNRLFIVEQSGQIRLVENGSLVATPFLDVSGSIIASGERGLLGLAFHPGFGDSSSPGYRKLYTYTSEPVFGPADFTVPFTGSFDHQAIITEWQVSAGNPDVVDVSTRREVMRVDEPQSNHNGGKIAFRPSDGFLYIGFGDGGNANDVGNGHTPNLGNGQDITNVLGAILRIAPLDPSLTPPSVGAVSANGMYRIPATNPFVGHPGVDEIFAYGFRNPFRFSFDAATNRFVVGDVGQASVEEVDLVESGRNYGWNRKEGSFLFDPSDASISVDPNPDPALINPVAEYGHADGISVIGGFVYHGSAVPALSGQYVFGDYQNPATHNGRLFDNDLASGVIHTLGIGSDNQTIGGTIKGFGEDAAGEVYVLADAGGSTGGKALKLISIPPAPALLNLSTRERVQTADNVLIGGFILTGSTSKTVVVRAIGPSLSVNGQPVAGRLMNPTLELHNGDGSLLAVNDDWMNGAQAQQIMNLGLAPNDSHESALLASLLPGPYTAIVRGTGSTTGIGLVEVYDVAPNAAANPGNLSARGLVQTGDNVMIGGFIIGGTQTQRVLIRALGPSLAGQNISGVLADPTLELHDGSGAIISTNDNWRSTQETEIDATGIAPTNDNESAILATLAPGNYTAIVSGKNGTTGVALVEVYRLAP